MGKTRSPAKWKATQSHKLHHTMHKVAYMRLTGLAAVPEGEEPRMFDALVAGSGRGILDQLRAACFMPKTKADPTAFDVEEGGIAAATGRQLWEHILSMYPAKKYTDVPTDLMTHDKAVKAAESSIGSGITSEMALLLFANQLVFWWENEEKEREEDKRVKAVSGGTEEKETMEWSKRLVCRAYATDCIECECSFLLKKLTQKTAQAIDNVLFSVIPQLCAVCVATHRCTRRANKSLRQLVMVTCVLGEFLHWAYPDDPSYCTLATDSYFDMGQDDEDESEDGDADKHKNEEPIASPTPLTMPPVTHLEMEEEEDEEEGEAVDEADDAKGEL